MKKFFVFLTAVALVAFVSCQKQQTEAEKNAEIDRQVQQRLAAEHQADQEKQLSQRESDVDAREKAMAGKENATPAAQAPAERSESESYEPRDREPRVREPRESGPSGAARGYSTFYTRLESDGDWIETGDYGYVFHPREAESSRWRPYTNGRWAYTDVGWTWISEESFGWATYHYGRCTHGRRRGFHGARATNTSAGRRFRPKRVSISAPEFTIGRTIITTSVPTNIASLRPENSARRVSSKRSCRPNAT